MEHVSAVLGMKLSDGGVKEAADAGRIVPDKDAVDFADIDDSEALMDTDEPAASQSSSMRSLQDAPTASFPAPNSLLQKSSASLYRQQKSFSVPGLPNSASLSIRSHSSVPRIVAPSSVPLQRPAKTTSPLQELLPSFEPNKILKFSELFHTGSMSEREKIRYRSLLSSGFRKPRHQLHHRFTKHSTMDVLQVFAKSTPGTDERILFEMELPPLTLPTFNAPLEVCY